MLITTIKHKHFIDSRMLAYLCNPVLRSVLSTSSKNKWLQRPTTTLRLVRKSKKAGYSDTHIFSWDTHTGPYFKFYVCYTVVIALWHTLPRKVKFIRATFFFVFSVLLLSFCLISFLTFVRCLDKMFEWILRSENLRRSTLYFW